MRLFGRRIGARTLAVGSDEILCGFLIPGGTTINNAWITGSYVGAPQITISANFYAVSAYILPVLDPDTALSYETLWDELVPKDLDVAAGAFDMDTGAADVTPFYEPGEMNFEAMMGMRATDIERYYNRVQMLTFPRQGGALWFDTTNDTWIPIDYWKSTVKKKFFVDKPSVLLFGVSNPAMDDESTTVPSTPATESHWMQLRYAKDTIVDAMKWLAGLAEAGAESPYEEAATRIADWLFETLLGEAANHFTPATFDMILQVTLDVTVEGELDVSVLSSEGGVS